MSDQKKKLQKEIADLYYKLFLKKENIRCYVESYESYSELDKLAEIATAKIDTLNTLEKKTPESNMKCTILKASVEFLKIFKQHILRQYTSALDNLLKQFQEHKLKPCGIYLYITILIEKAFRKLKDIEEAEASAYALLIKKEYERYLKAGSYKPLSVYDLLDLPVLRQLETNIDQLPQYINFAVWKVYKSRHGLNPTPQVNDITLQVSMPAFRYCFSNLQLNKIPHYSIDLMGYLADMMKVMLENGQMKLFAHLLGSVWIEIFDYRRMLPPTVNRNDLDEPQGRLSVLYTGWGKKIVEDSLKQIIDGETVLYDNDTFEVVNTHTKSDCKIFVKIFPITLITDENDIRRCLKRAKQWNKRAIKLLEEHTSTSNLHEIPYSVQAWQDEKDLERLEQKVNMLGLIDQVETIKIK